MENENKEQEEGKTVIATQLELVFESESSASDADRICPECGSEAVIPSGHCRTCVICGWSLCSI